MAVAPRLLGYSATRLLGGRLEEEGGEVVGGGATEIGGDGLGRKEGLYVSGIVAEADHLDGQLFGGGVEKEIALRRDEACDHCHGTGAEPGSKVETCPECHGSGQVRRVQNTMLGQMQTVTTCPRCHGEGKIVSDPCHECRGAGLKKEVKHLKVKIPAGVDNGSRLRVANEGAAGAKGGPHGDLYVYLFVKPHKFFERDGNDVYCEVPINIVEATLGAEKEVPTLDGKVVIKIPEGTQPGRVMRLRGKGIPRLRGSGRGDQLVRIKVVVPTKLKEKQKKILQQFADAAGDSLNPEEKGFMDKIKDLFK